MTRDFKITFDLKFFRDEVTWSRDKQDEIRYIISEATTIHRDYINIDYKNRFIIQIWRVPSSYLSYVISKVEELDFFVNWKSIKAEKTSF